MLNPNGRYAHDAGYVRRCLEEAGFAVLSIESAILRTEGGDPVLGLVVVGQMLELERLGYAASATAFE